MSITNGLCTLDQVRGTLYAGASGATTADDARIEVAIEAASREIERVTGRSFTVTTSATRVFRSKSSSLVFVDDISAPAGLVVKTDTSGDLTYATTLTSAQYQCEPLNQIRDGNYWPFTEIRAFGTGWFTDMVSVTATWGWTAIPKDINQAAIAQSINLLRGAESAFGVAGVGDMGVMRMRIGLHPNVEVAVRPYCRNVLVG